jgi:predicted enzyme related to lactoylglutathione lyase
MTKAQLVKSVAAKVPIPKKTIAEILDVVINEANRDAAKTANPVGWFEIYVQNMRRAKKFYESVFQVKLTRLQSPAIKDIWGFPMELNRWGAGGALVRMKGFAPGGNSTIVYFNSEDCARTEKRVVRFGGSIEKKKFSVGEYGFISLVLDTEGNVFGLHSLK